MTDNVIELRRLLDERGIEYEGYGCEITLRHDGRIYRIWAYDDERLAMSIAYLTPEQAIAATLGDGDDADAVAFCKRIEKAAKGCEPLTVFGVDYSATLGGGKLTVEQVRKCVRVGACDHGLWDVLDEDTDWQAIADELNAMLGSRECEMRESSEYVECKVQTFTCSACGWHGAIDDLFVSDANPNFCPNCGCKAVER